MFPRLIARIPELWKLTRFDQLMETNKRFIINVEDEKKAVRRIRINKARMNKVQSNGKRRDD